MGDDQGGYDDGYAACPCFWGRGPGSLVKRLLKLLPVVDGLAVLDAGCGEGKNAFAFASKGAHVEAVDCSKLALRNARALGREDRISWRRADIRSLSWPMETFDIVIAYGLLHCLKTPEQIEEAVVSLKAVTRAGGWHIVCAFNARQQDLSAHPGFEPCLLAHQAFVRLYEDWLIEFAHDGDLHETHPHNKIPHVHSLTRLLARRPF